MKAPSNPKYTPHPTAAERAPSSSLDAFSPSGGQVVLPGFPGQLALDGRTYAPSTSPDPSGEAASRSLGPSHGLFPKSEPAHNSRHLETSGFGSRLDAPGAGEPGRASLGNQKPLNSGSHFDSELQGLQDDAPPAPLDSVAESACNTPPLPTRNRQLRLNLEELDAAPQLSLWQRLDVVHDLVRGGEFDRQGKCQRTRRVARDEDVGVFRHESGGYTLSGLVKCNLWTCPCCGPQRAREASSKLAVAFQRHRVADVFHDLWMLTLTIPHYADDDLRDVVSRLKDAYARFLKSRAWKRFAKRWDIVGVVRALDSTHGERNGSHPHWHIALFPRRASVPTTFAPGKPPARFPRRDDEPDTGEDLDDLLPLQPLAGASKETRRAWLDELRGGLIPAWESACCEAGVTIRRPTDFRQKSLKLSPSEDAAAYFAKWGLSDEIGAPTAKSRSHLRLLDAVGAGMDAAGDAFIAFRDATDGVAWMTGLTRIARRYNVTDEDAEAHLSELRRRREAELAAAGTPVTYVRPLSLTIRPHLYKGALAAKWPAVFTAIDEADARGDDVQSALDRFLWQARVEARRHVPDG